MLQTKDITSLLITLQDVRNGLTKFNRAYFNLTTLFKGMNRKIVL